MNKIEKAFIALVFGYFLVALYGYTVRNHELKQIQIKKTKLSIEILTYQIKKLKAECK